MRGGPSGSHKRLSLIFPLTEGFREKQQKAYIQSSERLLVLRILNRIDTRFFYLKDSSQLKMKIKDFTGKILDQSRSSQTSSSTSSTRSPSQERTRPRRLALTRCRWYTKVPRQRRCQQEGKSLVQSTTRLLPRGWSVDCLFGLII